MRDGYASFPRRVAAYVLYAWGIPGYLLLFGLIVYLEGEKGWTAGKRVLGMRVEDANRRGALPFYLGLLWPIWDRRRQAWHDKIARSVVIRATADNDPA